MSIRVLEIIFFLYFASHIPITLFIDLQALLPAHVYPQTLRDVLEWYSADFKDPMVTEPPEWFKSFVFCKALVQLPFFPVAAYAFFKGGCKWIRTPAIVYSVHMATTLVPILNHIMFYEFPVWPRPGPQTLQERLLLLSIYAPHLLLPLLILFTMLLSPTYNLQQTQQQRELTSSNRPDSSTKFKIGLLGFNFHVKEEDEKFGLEFSTPLFSGISLDYKK